jgi:TfoX/Sxy family transcriptional regulator of competence genes
MGLTRAYQNRLSLILDELNLGLSPDIELQVKPFFGGAAAYANGHICLSLTKVGFAVNLPEVERQELLNKGAQPLRYFPNAPVKKEYVILPASIVNEPDFLQKWVRKCIFYITGTNS